MATLAPRGATSARKVTIAPDRYERFLGIAAAALLVVMLAAIVRGYDHWPRISLSLWLHLATIALALALTPILMLRPRGTAAHRWLGRVWSLSLVLTALVSFDIRLVGRGGFSWIHLLSIWTLIQVPILWWSARRHQVARHRSAVRGMVTGALLIAGFFTFPFGRLLGSWLFGQ